MILELPAELASIGIVTDAVNELLDEVGCPIKAVMQIDVAIDEIMSNIALYAYDGEGSVEVAFEADTDSATIVFSDRGRPYDPLAAEAPDLGKPLDEREPGGLGIFIVRKTMDEISYRHEDGRNVLTVRKLFKRA